MTSEGYSTYSLSESVGQRLAAEPPIRHALDMVHSPNNEEWPFAKHLIDPPFDFKDNTEILIAEMWEDLTSSPLYAAFSVDDRLQAMRYVNRLAKSETVPEWTITGSLTAEGRLFPVYPIDKRIPSQAMDLGILTGYGAIDMFEFERGGISPDDYATYGFDSLLGFAQFLAASSAARLDRDPLAARGKASYTKWLGYGIRRLVMVSADFEGDMFIATSEYYPSGAQDILGTHQEFAPSRLGKVELSGYHSTEDQVLSTLMEWASNLDLPEEVQRKYFVQAVFDALKVTDEIEMFSAQHYDTGFDSRSVLDIRAMLEDQESAAQQLASGPRDHVILGDQAVFGTSASLKSYLRRDRSLMMRIDSGGGGYQSDEIVFTPDELPMLVRALVEQTKKGLGRTSFETVVGMIAYRFSPKFRAFVDSPEFYKHDNRLAERLAEFYSAQ